MTSVAPRSVPAGLDPATFSIEAIDSDTSAFNAQLAQALASVPPVWEVPAAETRAAREEGRGAFGPLVLSDLATNRTIATPGGPLTIRTFVPETVAGVYLYFHGGGWTIGRAHHSDARLEALARSNNLAVVSVDYRLAPEDPYPAGPDDCEAAALWLIDHAQSEFGASQLQIGGESAGAHLAVVTLVRLRDKHQLRPFARANLVYGCFDLAGTPSVRNAPADTLVLPRQAVEWFTAQFSIRGKEQDPDVSPIWADLRGLPPALFSVGTLDPLLDDSLFMYTRWVAAGNQAELAVYPGGVHGFNVFPYRLAQQANQRVAEFLKS
ncbi:MAG: alpha/beta hydrolase [Chloroflexi bacterium]|nr:alpha/beta hydrolase [Chloroflexota bacterium]MBV9601626.1 alpha/beta hydrolase [Chloroflexota bacterium]